MYTVEAPPAQVLFWSSMPQPNETLLANLAHELRQPLSTMESIAYYLELSLPHADERVREQLTRLRHLVEQSGWMLYDALTLEKEMGARPGMVDLDEMVSEFVLEQLQEGGTRGGYQLDLGAGPAWMDVEQARELVGAVGRLMHQMARPGSDVTLSTRMLASGSVLLRAVSRGNAGEEVEWPAGAQMTMECIEKLAGQNGASVFRSFENPEQMELLVEIPAAPMTALEEHEALEALRAFEATLPSEPTASNIL